MMSDDILWELEIKHYMENQRREDLEEGEEKGFQRGIALGEIKSLINLVKKGYIPLDKAIEESGLSKEEFEEKLKKL